LPTARIANVATTLDAGAGPRRSSCLLSAVASVAGLLDELAEAVACGYVLKLEVRLAVAPPVLSAALQAASLARYAGVPSARLDEPLPKGGPRELLRYVRAAN
jgi:hypothetical protein